MLKNNIPSVLVALLTLAGSLAAAPSAALGAPRAARASTAPPAATVAGPLHVPSPDWRDEIVYFVVTDRFADGDAANNDQGAGEFRAGDNARYNGGDLAGLTQRLDYIRGLGATALWITPPVANQWLDPSGGYAGYHGYWAENFMRVDRHLGTLADYQQLSRALHGAGMHLVQDIVVNHTGNYYTYRDRWNAADPAQGYEAHDATPPVARPSQPPFDRNDPRDPAQRAAGVYHWTPDIRDYNDPLQEHDFQMSGLDDLNTENPVVRRALRRSYGYWIDAVGVDAFRIDTAFYVPPAYFDDFLQARDAQAPGIAAVARRSGRTDFLSFGEGFAIDAPGQEAAARKIEGYMHDARGRALLPGMLNFPLYGALGDAFARGRPPAELGARITSMLKLHPGIHRMPSFVDNHDVDRFLAGGSVAGLRQALLALMTLPGIPVIYYGTEQGFTEPRAAMFAAGFGAGGRDHYDTGAPLYRDIAQMSALRRGHRLFSRGLPTVLAGNRAQAGALAWRTSYRGRSALVVFNTAETPTLLAGIDTGLSAGTSLQPLYGLDGMPEALVVGAQGRLTLALPPRAGMVWSVGPKRALTIIKEPSPSVDALVQTEVGGDFEVAGWVPSASEVRVVVDGDLATAQTVKVGDRGRWTATLDTSRMIDPAVPHSVTAWIESRPAAPGHEFRVVRDWQLRADVDDPAGDDSGPDGNYRYPAEGGWGGRHLGDLRRVRAYESGGALRLELGLAAISTTWNPPNGFDHVAVTVFIELPGSEGGARVMPLQNATLPEGMHWHRRLRVGGWTNALFDAAGASATSEGTPLTPGAVLRVDRETRVLSLTVPAAALGRRASLRGAKLYVTTWDYDGGYRALGPQPLAFGFGGGAADGAKVMDASAVITLP